MDTPMVSWLIYLLLTLPFIMLAVIFALALGFYKKRNRSAARQLIAAIKSAEEDDRRLFQEFLQQKIGLNEKDSKKLVKKLTGERKFFFRNLIASLLNQKVDALAGLNDDLNRMLAIYHGLSIKTPEAEPVADTEDSEKVEALKAEIKTLKHEVHITLTTLNNIFAEFSSMFGEEVPNREMSVDQIITAMESFAGKGQVADGSATVAASDNTPSDPVTSDEDSGELLEADAGEEDVLEELVDEETVQQVEASETEDFSIDDELDEIDSALDELELSAVAGDDEAEDGEDAEPSWDEAFEESGDKPE